VKSCSEIPLTLKGFRVDIQWISGIAEELLPSQGEPTSMALVRDMEGAVWTVSIGCLLFLFFWRYNPLWLYFHSPVAGFSLLVFEVS
jgi:hypothetical protein